MKAQEMRSRLMEGIPITNFKLVDKIIELITKFLKANNFDEKLFFKMMQNTKFSIRNSNKTIFIIKRRRNF